MGPRINKEKQKVPDRVSETDSQTPSQAGSDAGNPAGLDSNAGSNPKAGTSGTPLGTQGTNTGTGSVPNPSTTAAEAQRQQKMTEVAITTLQSDVQSIHDRLDTLTALLEGQISQPRPFVREEPPHPINRRREQTESEEEDLNDYRERTPAPRRNDRLPSRSPAPSVGTKDHTQYIKIKEPDTFDGKRDDLPLFLTAMRMLLELKAPDSMPEVEKVIWASTFFRGAAARWWQPHYNTPPKNRKSWMYDFEEFCIQLDKTFGDPDRIHTAENKVMTMRQGTYSVAEYHARFMTYAADLEWNEPALKSAFRRGLQHSILKALALRAHQPKTFVELVDLAIRLDNNEREMRNEHRSDDRYKDSRHDSYRRNTDRIDDRRPRYSEREKDPRESRNRDAPAKVRFDVTARPANRFSDRPSYNDKPKGQCFICNSKDHYAPDCPKREKRFNNMYTVDESGPEEAETDAEHEGVDKDDRVSDSGSDDNDHLNA